MFTTCSNCDFVYSGAGAGEVHNAYGAVFGDQQGVRLHAARRVSPLHHHHGELIDALFCFNFEL